MPLIEYVLYRHFFYIAGNSKAYRLAKLQLISIINLWIHSAVEYDCVLFSYEISHNASQLLTEKGKQYGRRKK